MPQVNPANTPPPTGQPEQLPPHVPPTQGLMPNRPVDQSADTGESDSVSKAGDSMTGNLVMEKAAILIQGDNSGVNLYPDHIVLSNCGGIVLWDVTGTKSITLTIDDATGDLMIYNTNREKSINLTKGFAE
jgi:hypothetical protein